MSYMSVIELIILFAAIVAGFRFAWELLQQNGRMLLRMEALEKLINRKAESGPVLRSSTAEDGKQKAETARLDAEANRGDGSSAPSHADERAERFSNHSLENSRIKRDGLKAGTVAPDFRQPRLDGGELSLSELRGRLVLLVFSSPHCGPCNALAPKLEKFHRKHPQLQMVMISKDKPEANREKVNEHGLTFPVVLQKQWEVSRDYAYFATPVAYLVDGAGVIIADVAVGVDAVLELIARAKQMLGQEAKEQGASPLKRLAAWNVRVAFASVQKLSAWLGKGMGKLQFFELKHFKLVPRPDDIFIVTYPRSGTTWMQMILYQLTTDGKMDMAHIAEHCPWFERSMHSAEGFENRPSPRTFKTHLAFHEVPKGPGRYIYIARDGRDVAVSYYNLYRNYNGYKGTFAEFFEQFMRGNVHYGSWFKHVGGWWKHRNDLSVLFLTYEELTRDLEGCIRRIIAFCHLEVPLEKLPRIIERCSFAFMKQHESKFDPALEMLWESGTQLNSFLRAGRTGEGARQLVPEQQVRYDHAFRVLLEPNGFPGLARVPTIEEAAPIRNVYSSPALARIVNPADG
jgi:peroxiredoxin